jgi:ATP-dependent Clp protease ATP-binding subunit ClpB
MSKLKILGMDLANLKEDRNKIFAKWKSEKDVVDNIQAIKTEIEDFKYEAERAEREGDYGKVEKFVMEK